MRTHVVVGAVMGAVLAVYAGVLLADRGDAADAAAMARLVAQLGDEDFSRREAASAELVARGEPAFGLLRQAAATSRDLEIRWRAEQIAQAVVARTLPAGQWHVTFTNGVTESCWIGNDGAAAVDEPQRRSGGRAVVQDGSTVIRFDDDRTERWTWDGDRLIVEHWFPSSQFPAADPVVGVAVRDLQRAGEH